MQHRTLARFAAEHEALQKRFGALAEERDGLVEAFEAAIGTVQSEQDARHAHLLELCDEKADDIELLGAEANAALQAAELDPEAVREAMASAAEELHEARDEDAELRGALKGATRMLEDARRVLRARLAALGIPEREVEDVFGAAAPEDSAFPPLQGVLAA